MGSRTRSKLTPSINRRADSIEESTPPPATSIRPTTARRARSKLDAMEVAPSADEDEIQRQISSEHERAALEDVVEKQNNGAVFTRPKFIGRLSMPEHAVEDEEDEDAEGEDVEMEVGVGTGYDGRGNVNALPRRDSEYVVEEDEDEDVDAEGDSDDEMVDG
jgi:histone acetyltransferase SAS3